MSDDLQIDLALPDRFEMRRPLGAGAFGEVYAVYDHRRQAEVALKRLRRFEPVALARFKQEFRSLTDVVHPNLVTLYELVADGELWCFTMALVPGVDFLSYICDTAPRSAPLPPGLAATLDSDRVELEDTVVAVPTGDGSGGALRIETPALTPATPPTRGPADPERLRGAIGQLAQGVHALHQAGQLHRDLKPSNVKVTPEGRVVLLDFGLVTTLDPDRSLAVPDLVGTPHYMAPEQAAGEALTAAADWYAVGVMLYEGLTGQLPFSGGAARTMLRKQHDDPTAPSSQASDVPEDLDRLCVELLRRDPSRRPEGATVLSRLGVDTGSASFTTTPAAVVAPPPDSAPGPLDAFRFVGRHVERRDLHEAFAQTETGRPVLVQVLGPSGIGKTALIETFLAELRDRAPETRVLRGRCYQQESLPFKGIDSVIDDLAAHLSALPHQALHGLAPAGVVALCEMFPVLRPALRSPLRAALRAQGTDPGVRQPPNRAEQRRQAFAALRQLLRNLCAERPLVIWIDDLQWGDADSGALLADLLRPPEAPPLLWIATHRGDTASRGPLLERLAGALARAADGVVVSRLALAPLSQQRIEELARHVLVDADAAAEDDGVAAQIARIARESDGSPYLASELARHVRAHGAREVPAGATLERVFEERRQTLPREAQRLLEVVCVAGHPVTYPVATAVAQDADSPGTALAALRAGRWIRADDDASTELLEAYHDRIREAVVASLAPGTRAAIHLQLADGLIAEADEDPEHVTEHLLAAGARERAGTYAARAAARADAALAFARAARYYALSLEAESGGEPERQRLRVALAKALANAGRAAESGRAFLEAAAHADDDAHLDLRQRAADQLLRSGHLEEGLATIRDVLQGVGLPWPGGRRRALAAVVWQWGRLRLRGLDFTPSDPGDLSPTVRRQLDACWSLFAGLTSAEPIHAAYYNALGARLALDTGEPRRVALALMGQADAEAFVNPRSRHAEQMLTRGTELADEHPDPRLQGYRELALGSAALYRDRFRRSLAHTERALHLFQHRVRAAGWEIAINQLYVAYALNYLGRWGELQRRLPGWLARAEQLDDRFAWSTLGLAVGATCHLMADDPERAERELDEHLARWRVREIHVQHLLELVSRIAVGLYRGAAGRMVPYVDRQWRALKRARMIDSVVHRWPALYSRGRILLGAAVESLQAAERRTLLRRAERDVRRLDHLPGLAGPAMGSLLAGGVASLRDDDEAAVTHWRAAESACLKADMQLHVAVARRLRGQAEGGDAGTQLVEGADRFLQAQGIRRPERIAWIVAPSRPGPADS